MSRSRAHASLVALVLFAAGGAAAQPDAVGRQALESGLARFNAGELKEAVRLLALAATKLTPGPARGKAYLHEGLAWAYLGHKDEAKRAFTLALAEDPSARVDRERVPPDAMALFDSVLRERGLSTPAPSSGRGAAPAVSDSKRLPYPPAKRIGGHASAARWSPRVGLALGFGATLGSSGGATDVTKQEAERALFFAPAHLAFEGTYFVTPRFEVGLELRVQLTNATVGVEPRVRYTFGDGRVRFYLQVGVPVLRVERDTDFARDFFDEGRDTLTTGTVGVALGAGVTFDLTRNVGLSLGVSSAALFPDVTWLLDFGLRVRARF